MQHVSILHVFDALGDLPEELCRLVLFKGPLVFRPIVGFHCLLRLDLLKEFTALTVLKKYVNVLVVLKGVIKLDNLCTPHLAVDPDFVESGAL